VQQDELKRFLTDIAAERLALLQRHEAAARVVGHYDFNNTYQYVIAREETHLSWLQSALAELSTLLPQSTLPLPTPEAPKAKKADVSAYRDILAADVKFLTAFVARWRDRVATVTHARHQTMLNVVLGESLEHQRLFDQAADGFEDVIGRRTGGVARVGAVLPDRWQE
jgi:Mn-containing catalase